MSGEKDLENGDPKRERISFADGWDPDKDEGEYANLLRYISTYRDRRFSKAPSQVSGDDVADASKPKKKNIFNKIFGGGDGPGDLFEVPEDWVQTDINTGLSTAEVESRRKKTGYNELATEKENMFMKFLGYFRGPILYGERKTTLVPKPTRLTRIQSWNWPSFLLLVSKIGSISVSSSVFYY